MTTITRNPFYQRLTSFYTTNTKICSIYLDSDSHMMCITKNNTNGLFDLYCVKCSSDIPNADPHESNSNFDQIFSSLIDKYMDDPDENFYSCIVDDEKYIDKVTEQFFKIDSLTSENKADGSGKKFSFNIVNVCRPSKKKSKYDRYHDL